MNTLKIADGNLILDDLTLECVKNILLQVSTEGITELVIKIDVKMSKPEKESK